VTTSKYRALALWIVQNRHAFSGVACSEHVHAGSQILYCGDRSVCFFLFLLRRRSFCRLPPSYHVVVIRRPTPSPPGAQWFIHMALNQA